MEAEYLEEYLAKNGHLTNNKGLYYSNAEKVHVCHFIDVGGQITEF